MVAALFVRKTLRLGYSKRFDVFSRFCVLDSIHFPFNLRHTKTIKILMSKNEQKPELEPCYEKRGIRSRSHTHENQDLRSWSHVQERRVAEPKLCHFCDGSAVLK